PQNRFWRVMFSLFDEEFSTDTEKRRQLCIDHGIALWDVVKSCEIEGAADSSIKNAAPNDLGCILEKADIKAIFTTGKTAEKLYKKLCQSKMGIPAIVLPSPSGANCAVSFDKLLQSYRAILPFLKQQ
ncbi:MAG: DNA-deoxyinosine glycosylase, partial [Oscillospiraceae bacterium]|nr:DNA-deoxyinosine glycosylase [Oscillospiraceae bacterium]